MCIFFTTLAQNELEFHMLQKPKKKGTNQQTNTKTQGTQLQHRVITLEFMLKPVSL